MSPEIPVPEPSISRAEFEDFVNMLTHEIRNQLNVIGLEAADLAEQVGDTADAQRLQEKIRKSAAFLKALRNLLISEEATAQARPVAEVTERLRNRSLEDE